MQKFSQSRVTWTRTIYTELQCKGDSCDPLVPKSDAFN